MKRVSAQDLLSYAIFVLCFSVVLFARAEEWWEAPDWRPTSSDEKAFVQDYPGEHQFLAACRQGRVDVMEYWLSQKGFRPNDEFIRGCRGDRVSGLWVASQKGYTDGVKLLIEAGADLNQGCDGATPLYMASQNGRAEAVEILIQAGADLNQGCDGATPLYIASQNGHAKAVEILLKAGADLNQGYHGATPLYIASQNGHSKVLEVLLKAGADLNQGDHGATPLFIASQNGHAGVVQILAEAQADLEKAYKDITPLYISSQQGHAAVFHTLIRAGANPVRKREYASYLNSTPLRVAQLNQPLLRKMNPEKYDNYQSIIDFFDLTITVRKKTQKDLKPTGDEMIPLTRLSIKSLIPSTN